ncbi:pyridoxamine 5'-phosphate oxidase family protein [Clostridium sporogenes]|uniref:pyridoxamine 5'-phosphate oxidase family protein n=1 Tax=Clostridium sporogenes TaxID=1509 RepID=UPI0013D2B57F|nr:pyridoxamine 5'-phosphate oxidase family protein [Clostridium sporogenes]EJE7233924.1 pyridoxamine 5'-phosphate oxidase family protein [Clostridium botulinum]NFE79143.1 pyridoxamine 5'-phosphate oxidase family protein [Clostridium sporogenes]NFG67230.1 pyridoxamine 5'-phosphate oxidase family protein [Clostridium sporogenes]
MRRKEREIKDINEIFQVIENCSAVHVGMVDEGKPYVVALNFGYDREGDDLILYLHSAMEGRKMDILRKNPAVYFQMDCVNELIKTTPETPCAYSWRFDSVMGSGNVEFIEDETGKSHALTRILQHLDKTDAQYNFPSQALSKTCAFRVCSNDFTGKRRR